MPITLKTGTSSLNVSLNVQPESFRVSGHHVIRAGIHVPRTEIWEALSVTGTKITQRDDR